MKKVFTFLVALLFASQSWAQLTGTKTIPGDYASLELAVAALNTQGVGAGGVTFNIAAGYTETPAGPIILTATGTAANPIVFQKSGVGLNPVISRTDAGTLATSALGAQGDAVIIIQGSDYVTFDQIDVSASNSGIEYGYYLRKASVTDGVKNVTIKNAKITMTKGTSAYVAGIYSSNNDAASLATSTTGITVTSTGGRNENVTISGNTISNVFAGIVVRGYNHGTAPYDFYDQNFVIGGSAGNGNVIQNYAGNTASAAYAVYLIYFSNPTVSYNTFDNVGGGGANATSTLYGIFGSTSNAAGTCNFSNNNITLGISATSAAHGIHIAQPGTSMNISNNTFSYGTFASTTTSYSIYCSNATPNLTINGNQTSGAISKSGASGAYYFIYNYGSPTSGTATISNNTISNVTLTGSSSFYGIYYNTSNTQQVNADNNSVSNTTVVTGTNYPIYVTYGSLGSTVNNNTVTNCVSGVSGGNVYGLYVGNSSVIGQTVSGNTISGLACGGANTVAGIYVSSAGGSTATSTAGVNVFKNKIYDLTNNNTSGLGYTHGISVAGGTLVNIYNNFISDLKNPAGSNSTESIRGISINSSTTTARYGVYYNTVFLNATSTGLNFSTTGIYHMTSSTATTAALDLRNNIVVNLSATTGTGIAAAYRRSSTYNDNLLSSCNNNDFYAGTPSASRVLYYNGTTGYQTMADLKTFLGPREGASISENPNFVNIATTPYDLKINPAIATQIESGAGAVTSPAIADDYFGSARYPNVGYPNNLVKPATAPDMGAHEFAGIALDLNGPTITYTPLPGTHLTAARTLTATITDPSGVPTSGAGLPVLYWKINSGSYTAVTGVSIGSNQYTFTFGAGVSTLDVVSYYIVAQDLVTPTPNVSCAPSTGATGFGVNPPAASTAPTTPSTYTIMGTIAGVFHVGAAQVAPNYTTLTNAITDLNNKVMVGAVTFILDDATYSASETFPITIQSNYGSNSTNTLTIKPNTGATTAITGSVASGALIKIKNSYTTLDGSNNGSTTRDLTITNTNTTSPQVVFCASVGSGVLTNVTVKNTILVNGATTSSALVFTDEAGTAGNFTNLTVQNNAIKKAYIACYMNGNVVAGNGSGTVITGNEINATGTDYVRLVAIYVQGLDGVTISNNNIGNIIDANAEVKRAIWLATGTSNTSITGNTITNVGFNGTSTSSGTGYGIALTNGIANSNILIKSNTLTNINSTGASTTYGIYLSGAIGNVTIERNSISTIKNTSSEGYGANGIYLSSTLATTAGIKVQNNLLWDIASYGYSGVTYLDNGYGIYVNGGFGYDINFNTVYLNTNQVTTAGTTAAINISSSVTAVGAINLQNNIFINAQSDATTRYAIYCASPNTIFGTIDYNDYLNSGTDLGYLGSARNDLAAIQTGFGGNTHSVSINPAFASASDLHPTVVSLNNTGTPIAGITTDYAGTTRGAIPDMGAYEVSFTPTIVTNDATSVTSSGATLNGSVTAANESVATSFDWGLTNAYGSNIVATPTPITGNTATAMSASLSSLEPNQTYHFRAKGVYNATNGYGADKTFTTSAIAPTVVTLAATSVTATGATINGTVNANNASTTATFEYGLTTSYGTSVNATPNTVTGYTATSVSFAITGLTPNTTYHFRVKGVNATGTSNGLDLTFTTSMLAPTVVTNAASAITTSSATLNGSVNANNSGNSTVTFEWGLTTAYGNVANATPSPVTGNTATSVSANLTGLSTNTTYHFRVKAVNSTGTSYGSDMSFLSGCPVPAAAGTITGPAAVCQGATGVNFSVLAIANATTYNWTLPTGATITAGSGTNSITVSFSTSAVSGNVTVAGANACASGTSSSKALTVNPLPVPTITGLASVCASTTGNSYSTEAGMTAYSWTVSAGGTITAGSNTNAITVSWNTAGAQTVTVNYTNANSCTATTATNKNVTVNALPTPTVSGPASACPGTTNNVYTTQSGQTSYVWTVSAGGTITNGAGTNSITVKWNTPGSQSVTVNYNNASGCSALAPVSYPVNIYPIPAPSLIGPTYTCKDAQAEYFTDLGMTNYTWVVPASATILSGQGTSHLVVKWNSTGVYPLGISYTGIGGCTMSAPAYTNIIVKDVPQTSGTITGSGQVCAGATGIVYTISAVNGATGYEWTVPTGATIASGAGTNSITVNYGAAATSGSVTAAAMNECGLGAPATLSVIVSPLPGAAGVITGVSTVCAGTNSVIYQISPIPGATGYSWTVPTGATIASGGNTFKVTVNYGSNAVSGDVTVSGSNSCGLGVASTLAITVNPIPETPVITANGSLLTSNAAAGNQWYLNGVLIPGATGVTYTALESGLYSCVVTLDGCPSEVSNEIFVDLTGISGPDASSFNLYPVPNDGHFTIEMAAREQGNFVIEITNTLGIKVYRTDNFNLENAVTRQIDVQNLPNGVYYVTLTNSKNVNIVRRMVINK